MSVLILDELGSNPDGKHRIVCEATKECMQTAHSAVCSCQKKHSLGRVHYQGYIVPACPTHIAKSYTNQGY